MIEQATGRRDQHIETAGEHLDLRAVRDAADDDADARAHELAIGAETVGDLRCEFARRRQHESMRRVGRGAPPISEQPVEDRQRESGRLARAGLGDAEQIAALQE